MLTAGLILFSVNKMLFDFFAMYTWWRDIIQKATFEDQHSIPVQRGLKLGTALFIVSEIMFFFVFFLAFFHSSIAPAFNINISLGIIYGILYFLLVDSFCVLDLSVFYIFF
jgi:heme/copper-type cytochrome/quinol oxidase subunit 3